MNASERSSLAPIEPADPRYWRRFTLALAVAIALHQISAGLFHVRPPETPEQTERVQAIAISVRTPAPTPSPTPRPTPTAVVTFAPHASHAQAAPSAAAPIRRKTGGHAAPRKIAVTPPAAINAPPEAIALGSANTGTGSQNGGSGSGAGAGEKGSGGLGGVASGIGGEVGNGNGAGVKPCGAVYLEPIPGTLIFNRDGSLSMRVRIEVTLSDGQTVEDVLGWRFSYRRAADDPFSNVSVKAGRPALLQLPPSGFDLEAQQKPATVFAVKHTNTYGFTDLEDCPRSQNPAH